MSEGGSLVFAWAKTGMNWMEALLLDAAWEEITGIA